LGESKIPSLENSKLEYNLLVKKIARLDAKIHAAENRQRTEKKFGHKQKDSEKMNQEIRMLHQEKRVLLKTQKKLKKQIQKLS